MQRISIEELKNSIGMTTDAKITEKSILDNKSINSSEQSLPIFQRDEDLKVELFALFLTTFLYGLKEIVFDANCYQ